MQCSKITVDMFLWRNIKYSRNLVNQNPIFLNYKIFRRSLMVLTFTHCSLQKSYQFFEFWLSEKFGVFFQVNRWSLLMKFLLKPSSKFKVKVCTSSSLMIILFSLHGVVRWLQVLHIRVTSGISVQCKQVIETRLIVCSNRWLSLID